MILLKTDVLVIGGGAAALRSAQYASMSDVNVLIVSRKPLDIGGTTNADVAEMAGFNSAIPGNEKEVEFHYEDILKAGQGMAEPKLARIVAEKAPEAMVELMNLGVEFEYRDDKLYTFQSCFSNYPRTHVIKGHGHQISSVIRKDISTKNNVTVLSDIVIISLITHQGECYGAYGVRNNEVVQIAAKSTILATGGAGAAFEKAFCPSDVAGSGYEIAYDCGAVLENLEFMQIGIGFSYPIVNIFNAYIWEALPKLSDKDGNDIFSSVLPLGMDYGSVANAHQWHYPFSSCDDSKYLEIAISKALGDGKGTENRGIYADLSHITDDYVHLLGDECGLHHMWPIARDFMKAKGVDLLSQKVEIAVFQHAMNGGIKIDEFAQSTIPGLFAVGECAGGPHGADRLGGNMFVTCMVFGKIAGIEAARRAKAIDFLPEPDSDSMDRLEHKIGILGKKIDVKPVLNDLKVICQDNLLVTRTQRGLERSLEFINDSISFLECSKSSNILNTENFDLFTLLVSMRLLSSSALQRKESRGSHYRMDYPSKNPLYERIIEVTKK